MADQTTGELRTPDEWCRIQGVQVLDPDGWRGSNGRPWADPISLAEFQERLATCTQRVSRNHPWCDAPDCAVCDAGERRSQHPIRWPISDELADAVLAVKERGVPCPPNCDYQTHRRAEMRAVLEAAYPAIRKQVAHEIAQALEQLDSPRYARDLSSGLGWTLISRDVAIQTILAVGAGTATARTGAPVTTDLPPTPQARSKRLPGARV